jgi:hypothetical protein
MSSIRYPIPNYISSPYRVPSFHYPNNTTATSSERRRDDCKELDQYQAIYKVPYQNIFKVKVLSRVRGYVTKNNGFWIGQLDMLHLIHLHSSGLQAIQRYR